MIYQDVLEEASLKQYVAGINARAASLGVPGRLTLPQVRAIILESGGRCGWCGRSLVGQPIELDHQVSLARGGANVPENMVVSCESCNRRKADRSPYAFAAEVYAASGVLTPLIERLLAMGHDGPGVQQSLFARYDEQEDPASPDGSPSGPEYHW